MLKLSIIIVTHNSEKLILPCIDSILKTTAGLDFKIIVIDNNSEDDSNFIVKNYVLKNPDRGAKIRLFRNKENIGFAKAVNQGIKLSNSQYILLLNPDMRVMNKTISSSLEFLEKNQKVGILGAQFLYPQTFKIQSSFGKFPTAATEFYYVFGLHKIFPCGRFIVKNIFSTPQFKKTHKVDWVSGGFLLVRSEVFKKIGFLDENFFMYLEDIDFCYRAKQAGFEVYYFPIAQIIHHYMASSKRDLSKPIIYEAKSLIYYFKKYKKNIRLLKFLIRLRLNERLFTYFLPSLVSKKYRELRKANKEAKKEIKSL